ncbi:peptide chain release factor N(5)-glutamine methyltransferase [Meiothermus sp. QL-1]|uniref:peptide chain release factor N(5)-glutamine methyltransferase n=1 Tax=Meiothermus sp. QL-1 TaxID=2058095 RepID=UPI000E0BB97D|nr:peptide chain release factor N(5)-glutamine methyltransferase [Meiothermus sp. QL-1]RDI96232.1 peptide chain release factor N(5)-glutamine methyltransferase [Meiothermus sp. QL-1]
MERRLGAGGKPPLEARWLLAHAAGLDLEELLSLLGRPVPEGVAERAQALLDRRLGGCPLQLILGQTEFYGLELWVEPGVLIPRPETEGLVELALHALSPGCSAWVLDVGTGSGAIALALKARRPELRVWATDINPRAIRLAQRNARRWGLEVVFLLASLTAGLRGLDLVVSNPPYLPEGYRKEAPPELAYEDEAALYAGPEGLGVARALLGEAWGALRPGGRFMLELAPENIHILRDEAAALGWEGLEVRPDLVGRPRYLLGRRPYFQ